MTVIIPLDSVTRVRDNIARAHALAAVRFREAFANQGDIPPNERWRAHLEIQAAALLEHADGVHVRGGGRVHYDIVGRTVIPWIVRGEALHQHFHVQHTPEALLEYWIITSEIASSAAWSTTRLIATSAEYDEALRRMQQPQLVRALVAQFLPEVQLREDGTALLTVTVYTRANEERVERRVLLFAEDQELQFHSRELLAEGRGGVLL